MSLTNLFGGSLPKLSGPGSVSDKLISYAPADTGKLLDEGFAKVKGVFGDAGPFAKLSSGLPTFEELKGKLGLSKLGQTALKATGASLASVSTGSGSATEIKAATTNDDSSDNSTSHKVKLVASVSDGESTAIQNDVNFPVEALMQRVVEFDVMPEVQEIHSAEYEALSAPHMPLEFQKYKGTKSIQWQINGTFTCRTRGEAMRNFIYLNNLRGWTKPYFGEKQRQQFSGSGKLGAPPPVLTFSGWRGLVGKVPTVITSLNWNWPKDCDWIPTGVFDSEGKEIPFPTVMNVNIALVESFSPDQVNGFDLVSFRNGRMVNAWLADGEQPETFDRSEPVGSNGGNQSITNGTPSPEFSLLPTTASFGSGFKTPMMMPNPLGGGLNYSMTTDEAIIRAGVDFKGPSESWSVPPVVSQIPIPQGDEGE